MENPTAYDGLKYIGNGTQIGYVPTRDLSAEEVAQYGRLLLLQSGLYIEIESTPKNKKAARKAEASAKES